MIRSAVLVSCGFTALIFSSVFSLTLGASGISLADIWAALTAFDDQSYDHFIIRHQRLPQITIAAVVGGALATSGAVLQGLMNNPLASPSLLGIASGATLFTVIFGFAIGIPLIWQGPIAFAGGLFGLASAIGLARLASGGKDPRGLTLILAGALVSMLYAALAQAVLLADATLRQATLGWVTGNINFAYADRLMLMAPLALAAVLGLWVFARPATLLTLGVDTAAAAGLEARRLWWLIIGLATLASSAAVTICGPVGFVGLVVPHILRPFAGADLRRAIPANMLFGAAFVILADVVARTAFAPRIANTGVVMDLLGGLVFIWLVRRVYLRPSGAGAA